MYDHYVALDWAQRNMAIARMTAVSSRVTTVDVPSNIADLQLYLSQLKGKKTLTFEETTTSQWLYTELREYVDELVVCDPRRNRLLSEGPKTDRIDAEKLVRLLRADLLKPVFHSGDQFIYLRKVVSGYQDLVQSGVRIQNQRAALFRAQGQAKSEACLQHPAGRFVLEGIERAISQYEQEKARYQGHFEKLASKHLMIRNLTALPGVGAIGAVKIAAIVVDARRFKNKGHFLSYCGLVKLDRVSGGKSYGKKNPRYCRPLKSVFKTAAFTAAVRDNRRGPMRQYYLQLLEHGNYPEHNARHKVARRIAILAYGVMKSGKRFDVRRLSCKAV